MMPQFGKAFTQSPGAGVLYFRVGETANPGLLLILAEIANCSPLKLRP